MPQVCRTAIALEPHMREAINNHIRAGYPGVYLVSHEETRAESELKSTRQPFII